MTIDRRFRRIADQIKTAELVQQSIDEDLGSEFSDLFGDHEPASERFVGFYSTEGILRVLDAYGVTRVLESRGLKNYDVCISTPDPFEHRLQLLLDGQNDEEHRIIDLKITLTRRSIAELQGGGPETEMIDLVQVEWLAMQDPSASFATESPCLPGQRYPGLGLGYSMHNMLLLMARRLHKGAVIAVPERYHLGLTYLRFGYLATDEDWRKEMLGVAADLGNVPRAVAAWAVERGCVRKRIGRESWRYRPSILVAPVVPNVERLLSGRGRRVKRWLEMIPRAGVEIDWEAFRASLDASPVPGLEFDDFS